MRITTAIHHPFRLDHKHFSFTIPYELAQQTHQLVLPAVQDDLGEGVVLGPCATALGVTTGLWLAAACAGRVVHGAVHGPTVRDWLAAVNDGIRVNAIVVRPDDRF